MKKFYMLMLMLVLLLVPVSTKTQEVSTEPTKPSKIVTVGYSIKDQKDLFGDKTLEEIDEILQKNVKPY